jgi:hypothetical protein
MGTKKSSQAGFHVIELVIALVVLAIIGFAGFKVFGNKSQKADQAAKTTQTAKSGSTDPVKWAFNGNEMKWFTQTGTAPACKDPFVFDQSPVDLSKILAVLMPGSYRGFSYKPHGGMRLKDPSSGKIEVRMPIDATLTGLTRYYEGEPAELQYLLTFETDCGIAFRFDHIYTLAPAFQAIAETTPKPKLNDTSSNPNLPFARTKFKSGDLVATEVGFPRIKNFGFDFGAYDHRKPNEISKNTKWANIHNKYQDTEWFGSCWIDMLPGADKAKAKELAFVVINPSKPNIISDYCTYAPHTTLDFNGGKPTDG